MRTRFLVRWALTALLAGGCAGAGPTTLASGQLLPWAIAVRDGFVYWTTAQGTVMKVPSGGGTAVTLASGQLNPSSVAVDSENVYWTNSGSNPCQWEATSCASSDGSLVKAPIGGGAPVTLAAGLCTPDSIALDATNVYAADPAAGTLLKVPIAGGAPVLLASALFNLKAIATDSTGVYVNAGGAILQFPSAGGSPTTLASGWVRTNGEENSCGQSLPELIVDATGVYWTTGANSGPPATLQKLPPGGGTPVTLATASRYASLFAQGIAGDGTNIYTTNGFGFRTISVNGGPMSDVAIDLYQVGPLALDGANIYWTDSNGHVMSTPKSP
jgi:hypothetical protein